jgi:hypothetical protein
MRAGIALVLFSHPLSGTHLPPAWDGAQDDFLADRNGEIIDEFAGEITALVAALDFLVYAAGLDGA